MAVTVQQPRLVARIRGAAVAWAVLLAAAAGFADWSGWSYWQADHSAAVTDGRLRDAVLATATREIADLNTVNDKHIAAAEARWLTDTTGALHRQVLQTNGAAQVQIKRVQTSSAATVTGAAVVRLNRAGGTARVIATVRVQQTASSGGVSAVSNRYLAVLTRAAGQWKISSLKPV
jgi:Mce-associated membrane protein